MACQTAQPPLEKWRNGGSRAAGATIYHARMREWLRHVLILRETTVGGGERLEKYPLRDYLRPGTQVSRLSIPEGRCVAVEIREHSARPSDRGRPGLPEAGDASSPPLAGVAGGETP